MHILQHGTDVSVYAELYIWIYPHVYDVSVYAVSLHIHMDICLQHIHMLSSCTLPTPLDGVVEGLRSSANFKAPTCVYSSMRRTHTEVCVCVCCVVKGRCRL